MERWAAGLALTAAAGVGGLSGSLTAESGHDPVVIGAVLPIVVSAMGVMVGIQLGRGKSRPTIAASLFVLLFSGAFYLGSKHTAAARAEAAREAATKELKLRTDYRRLYLQWCSQTELDINLERKALGLEALRSDFVCNEP